MNRKSVFREQKQYLRNPNFSISDCVIFMGEGQNYENQNVENQKELRKPCKPSQRRKELLKRSERRKANFQNVEKS